MKISKHISKGTMHKVFCEDFIIDNQINENYRILGVFDGCSSGIESHFASALLGKIVVSVSKNLAEIKQYLDIKEIVFQTLLKMKNVIEEIDLDLSEILSTMIILLVNLEKQNASIVAIGDGFVSVNQQITNIEQNNQPDYLAYHLDSINNYTDFEKYYAKLLKFNNVEIKDITISTDGINTFQKRGNENIDDIDVIKYLIDDVYLKNNSAMLSRKHNILRNKYNVSNADDLAIIRILG